MPEIEEQIEVNQSTTSCDVIDDKGQFTGNSANTGHGGMSINGIRSTSPTKPKGQKNPMSTPLT